MALAWLENIILKPQQTIIKKASFIFGFPRAPTATNLALGLYFSSPKFILLFLNSHREEYYIFIYT